MTLKQFAIYFGLYAGFGFVAFIASELLPTGGGTLAAFCLGSLCEFICRTIIK